MTVHLVVVLGLTYNSDRPWKILRRFALQALRDFGVGKKSLEEKVQEEVNVVMETLTSSKGEPIRVKPLLLSAATNIICNVMFGARFVGLLSTNCSFRNENENC